MPKIFHTGETGLKVEETKRRYIVKFCSIHDQN